MIQLKVYPYDGAPKEDAIFLDLYETQPIKLTLSIEDITSTDATSVYSKTFKVPATRGNNQFFQNAYEIDGIDFDITIKKPAEILVDGSEFKQGHVRLQKIFANENQDKTDYELLFLGETRDFSSAIGELTMCQLNLTDFNWDGLPVEYTNAAAFVGAPDFASVVQSWQAYPELPSLTAGLADGDLLHPLIDHGNQYDNDGNVVNGFGTISVGSSHSFTKSSHKITASRFKPMIRAKRLWDQIFENANYTYQSNFLDSPKFKQMYLSAFGNSEAVNVQTNQVTSGLYEVFEGATGNNDVENYMYCSNIVFGNANYNIGTPDTSSGGTGSYFNSTGQSSVSGGFYSMEVGARVDAQREDSDYGYTPVDSRVVLCLVPSPGAPFNQATVLATGNWASENTWSSLSFDSRSLSAGNQIGPNDTFQVYIEAYGFFDVSSVSTAYWHCNAAPGEYFPIRDLNCEYQQIDFIKDVVTMFRLVMQPDASRPNHFIIEPWQDFIGSGDLYDWSNKLVREKDFVSEPLFNTQSATIEFTMQEDEDLINKFHQDNNKHAYGWLRFNSQNELLKGKRDIEVKGISPTPVDQIQHGANAPHPYPQWILPSIVEVTGENFQRLPIVPKSRFLFYNGLQDIEVAQDDWFFADGTANGAEINVWPLVSPYENWPVGFENGGGSTVADSTLNLNFSNDTRYYVEPDPGAIYFQQGQTLFDDYWAGYISSIYNKFSRRVTAYFILNNVDLQKLSFDDLIFIDGKYYRPEKILDVQIGSKTAVKVQLITYKAKRPVWLNEPLTSFSAVAFNNNCAGAFGSIQVTTNGTPNFTWELTDSGQQGNYSAPVGQAPYIFQIEAPVGVDTLVVTDSFGRTAQITLEVPSSNAVPITSSVSYTDASICSGSEAACDGSITVSNITGGTAPYTINWADGTVGATRNNLCEGSYQYYIVDAEGCENDMTVVNIECLNPPNFYSLKYYSEDCGQLSNINIVAKSFSTYQIGDVVKVDIGDFCYEVMKPVNGPEDANITQLFTDCNTCQGVPSPVSWKVESCTTVGDFQYVPNNTGATLSPGLVIEITNAGAVDGCYTVIEESIVSPTYLVTNVFQDCATCETPPQFYYNFQGCDGIATYQVRSSVSKPIGQVIDVGGTCGTLISVASPNTGTDITFFPPYIDCDDCNGITPTVQNCHRVEGIAASSDFDYEFNGVMYTETITAFQVTNICAVVGSVATTTGSINVTDLGTACSSPKACFVPEPTECTEYSLTNDGGNAQEPYTYTDCATGFITEGSVALGQTVFICSENTPLIGTGVTVGIIGPC